MVQVEWRGAYEASSHYLYDDLLSVVLKDQILMKLVQIKRKRIWKCLLHVTVFYGGNALRNLSWTPFGWDY